MNEIDLLLLNLKIIGKIPENGRICRSEKGTIALEETKYFQWVKRYFLGDNRKQAISDIHLIVNTAFDKINDIIESKYFNKTNISEYEKKHEMLNNIYIELEKCPKGLEHLKKTYNYDVTTVSSLEILISKIILFNNNIKTKYLKDSCSSRTLSNEVIDDTQNLFT